MITEPSHPSWVCGLKPLYCFDCEGRLPVTPFVGVWIETLNFFFLSPFLQSHPSWVCGLKHLMAYKDEGERCHTLRGCVD